MANIALQQMAQESIDITSHGFYSLNGRQVKLLSRDRQTYSNIIVLSPQSLLTGARAQEESLCRDASLSSDKAQEMYAYNKKHPAPTDSDYALLSPNVCVFRDSAGMLLNEPFLSAVYTVSTPNRNERARNVSQADLDTVMIDRLRKFFLVVVKYGYPSLVLGARGCGVFGRNPERVASHFHHLLFKKGFGQYFEDVVFAIYRGGANIRAFREVFEQ